MPYRKPLNIGVVNWKQVPIFTSFGYTTCPSR